MPLCGLTHASLLCVSPMALAAHNNCFRNAFAACLSPWRHFFSHKTLPSEKMCLEALQDFHMYYFPIFKLAMQECSLDVHNMCQHTHSNHKCQHNPNSCWVCDWWDNFGAVVMLSFNLLKSSCVHLTTQCAIALLFNCPNAIDEFSAWWQIFS